MWEWITECFKTILKGKSYRTAPFKMKIQHIESNYTNTCFSKNTINPITVCVHWLQSSLSHSPLHIHSWAQRSGALTHLHRPWQPISGLHLHLIKSWTALDASSKSVQSGINFPLSYFQSHSSGGGSTWIAIKDWPHTWSAYYAALSKCFLNAAPVGEMLSTALP